MTNGFNFKTLEEYIKKSQRPLILTHTDPDGDAIGAVLTLKEIIESKGIIPSIFLSGKIESGLEFLKTPEEYFEKKDINNFDLLIILDTNNIYRTGIETGDSLNNLPPTFIIDHHTLKATNHYPDNINVLVKPKKTATCEMIFDLLKDGDIDISSNIANYLLMGIYNDSGGFFHSNTTPALLKKVKELFQKGISFKNITHSTDKGKSIQTLNFWGDKIINSRFHPKLKFLSTYLNSEEIDEKNISTEEIGGLANLLNMCKEASFSLFLREEAPEKIKGSLRSSEHKKTDVSNIAKFLEGGGHKLASGFELNGKFVEKDGRIEVKSVEKRSKIF